MTSQNMRRVVVGAALNATDEAVFAVALIEAQRRAAVLHVVHALDVTEHDLVRLAADAIAERQARSQMEHDVARMTLRDQVVRLAVDRGTPVPISYQIRRGDPATILLGAARNADLLIAGTRSGGTGSPLMLGRVSQDVAVHSSCPILLVPVPPGVEAS
jgi:nucleotide-binding universal stress UspA family protein